MNNIVGRVNDSVTRQEAGGITSVLWQPCLLPEWPATQAKHVFDISLGKMLQPSPNNPDDVETPYIKAINVQWSGINTEDLPTMWASSSEIKALNLKIDDLLVCEGGEVGRASILSNTTPDNCIYQNALHRVRSETNDVRYLKYCLKQASESGWFDVLCNRATIAHFTVEKFRELRIHIPPPKTQRLIADYLDRETARIDALVTEKEKMLALLEEKRAALISRAVTRGLNPDAPLKPSGLDWLGDIPTHWDVWKLKYVVSKIGSGVTPRGGAESYQSEGVPLFRSQNIHFDGLRMDDIVFIDSDTHDSMSNSKVLAGDVLINITGASIGRCFYIEEMQGEANVNQHVCIVRPSSQIETKFLYFTLRSDLGQHQIDLSQSGSGREGLNFESLGNFSVVIPPVSEQRAIIEHLETIGQKSAVLLTEIRNSISRLLERRAALITAAVSGQIPLEEMTE
ncbi:restriction endonuclease subunit S [Methylicorpusculum sp.]|uniref:restriction endonuclease subunit S n=1 Tax=Methylicorpusculum sp. TaxID=2713644 RepID=UPI002723D78A|nr:restriction endonuclease subunit S [Methylicorpusculum sp.]MDO8845443.1 restriction endonuclease subunit S [Methylicorpusculum sp.]